MDGFRDDQPIRIFCHLVVATNGGAESRNFGKDFPIVEGKLGYSSFALHAKFGN